MSSPLELLNIKQLLQQKNNFFIPAYQRGYRWRVEQVKMLIEDIQLYIDEENKTSQQNKCPFYCLQAIVVKENEKGLEVIDGQQRLTTVLIILQAYHVYSNFDVLKLQLQCGVNIRPEIDPCLYSVKYETREESSKWLNEITKAFLKYANGDGTELQDLKNKNSDYYHFVEAFETAFEIFDGFGIDSAQKLPAFIDGLKERAYFIWYNISQTDTADSEVDIFDRLNATKIALNNAELIKALFLQESNYGNQTHLRNQLAIDWDGIEKRLQDPSFWAFIYSTRHPYEYETHIEYIFDLLMNKSKDAVDDYQYTFNKYYEEYITETDRLAYVNKCWKAVNETMLMLEEWFGDKTCYHYIGYLLEYGEDPDSKNPITIPYLKGILQGCSKHERNDKLKGLIKHSLANVKAQNQFYKHSGNNFTQLLFLLNIETEQRRKSDTARFSFSEYKNIKKDPGWNLEHVASNTDYVPTYEEKDKLAYSLLEYFTGVKKCESVDDEQYRQSIQSRFIDGTKEKDLCEKILGILQIKENTDDRLNEIKAIYNDVLAFFCSDEDAFRDDIELTGCNKRMNEKDFIWNFALLNASTNKSYGNDIYPLKRKRIISDEESVYTPICTRAMFEKAYSQKLNNLMAWTRTDAQDYWNYICNTLKEFLPEGFNLPFNY